MLVSVAIPAYNGADYLREAIDSVLAQTHRELEVIVVDDGSTDHTATVCASFGERVKYVYQENDGTNGAGARAAAVRAATGEWVAILDQDDRWLHAKIEKQLGALRAMPEAELSFTGFRAIDTEGQAVDDPILTTPQGDVFHLLLSVNPYCASSALIKRTAIEKYGIPAPRPGPADYEWWLHFGRHCQVAVVPECLTEYRTHGENYSGNMTRLAEQVLELLDRQFANLHPDCDECGRSLRMGRKHFSELAADAHLNRFHEDARAGRMGTAWNSLARAARLSPRTVLSPKRAAAVTKNSVLGLVRGRTS
jgi:glycosyltransferase involved in cell wall biosynthesis